MRIVSKLMTVVALATFAACGGGSGKDFSKIKGTWQPTTFLQTISCPGIAPIPITEGSNVVWSMGTTADLVQTDSSSTCIINANYTGLTATALPNQMCTTHDADSDTIVITLASYTFSLGADGQTATEAGSGTAQVTTTTGAAATCTYTLQASYHKVGT